MPTSTTDVATSTWISPAAKRVIASSFSFGFIAPCRSPTSYSGKTSFCRRFASAFADFAWSAFIFLGSGSSMRGQMTNAFVRLVALLRFHDTGRDFRTARRQFVENGDVEVAVDGERERAGNGGRGHGEKVRRDRTFLRERAALSSPESVLFIDYRIGQVLELDRLLYERVRSHEHRDLAPRHPLQKL